MTDPQLTRQIIGTAITVHRELGPGLLEAVYEECPCHELALAGLAFRETKTNSRYLPRNEARLWYKADIVVLGRVIVEIKAISAVTPVHDAVMLTYLRLSGCHIGLLINFHSAILKDGVHRYVWNYHPVEEETERRGAEVAEK
jgi:GxxExxY protein